MSVIHAFLDSGPIGWLSNPQNATAADDYLIYLTANGFIPVLCDPVKYEVRRKLVQTNARGLFAFDQFADLLGVGYLPDEKDWHLAGELWARLRNAGRGGSHDLRLDFDVLIAACCLNTGNSVVVTANVSDFAAMLPGRVIPWVAGMHKN